MKVAEAEKNWSDANQLYLVAELARLKRRLGAGADEARHDGDLAGVRATLPVPAAIDRLTELFGLSAFERDLLLLCAGVEMDAELARLCGAAQGLPQKNYATFGLALAALENSHWSALSAVSPLRRWRLLEIDDNAGLAGGKLRIDERILHFLAGVNYLDPRLRPLLQIVAAPARMAPAQRESAAAIITSLREHANPTPVILLSGDDVDGQGDLAAAVAAQCGLQLQKFCGQDLPASAAEIDALAILWQREAALLGAALLVDCHDAPPLHALSSLAERVGGVLFVAAREPISLKRALRHFVVDKPDAAGQKEIWCEALGPSAVKLNGALDGVAAQFRLSAQRIQTTGAALRSALPASEKPNELLWRACREASSAQLDGLAQRVVSSAAWDDLILPDAQKTILRQIGARAKHRLTVYQQWGFAGKSGRGLGISALFAGESGTGKTLAAEVLAHELHLDLYRIDLSTVVSKYIGDTEKNLRRVFDAAEASGAILLFDEADALFGKRSEVRDSHDRYANIEVGYLLQRMEAYRGLAILTTNMKAALDVAFQRRLSFVVQFPFPDQQQRELIWRGVFPAATPVEQIDYAKLARLSMSGGNIRNIALNAAFLAADEGTPVRMKHLLQAAHGEAAKRDRPLTDAETRGWTP